MTSVAFAGDRQVRTRHGLIDVQVRHCADGRVWVRPVHLDRHPELSAAGGAVGADEEEAVSHLVEALNTLASRPLGRGRTPTTWGR